MISQAINIMNISFKSSLPKATMNFLIVLVCYIAVCSGNVIPIIPGDNSHYVEGESRYMWMPDGEGVPHLVDLEESVDLRNLPLPIDGSNNEYWLYTRRNPTNAQVLDYGDIESIWNSNYDPRRPLAVIVHGWHSDGNDDLNPDITAALLDVMDCNVIVVDWHGLAALPYTVAVLGVPSVGEHLGNFLLWLIWNAGGNWNNVHLIGHSLGAHVVGNAGRTAGGRPARVTGLDPAGPQWGGNDKALNRESGQYVESINTDGGVLGIYDPIADANFYPNGGRNPQPGCWISTCSHGRSHELFASSVRTNHLVGRRCANLDQVHDNECTGPQFPMGNAMITKRGTGLYRLETESSWPF